MALDNVMTIALDNAIRKFAKFEDADIQKAVYNLVESVDRDLEYFDIGPSSGSETSTESALEQLEEAISDYEETHNIVEDDEKEPEVVAEVEDDDDDVIEEDDDDEPPVVEEDDE